MKKAKSMAMLAALMMASSYRDGLIVESEKKSTQKKVIPKGCKEYVFEESFGTLKVIASNEKTALKKYDKWCKENIIKDL